MSTAVFEPPSPGAWELERTHATRPMARFMWASFVEPMKRGFSDSTREYGALLDHIELAIINGFMYSTPRAVGAPKTAQGPPPKLLFKLLVKLHPEVRRRVRRSDSVFRDRLWRKELDWWDREIKPERSGRASAAMSTLRYLGAVAGTMILSVALGDGSASVGQQQVALWIFASAFGASAISGLGLAR